MKVKGHGCQNEAASMKKKTWQKLIIKVCLKQISKAKVVIRLYLIVNIVIVNVGHASGNVTLQEV